MSRDAAMKQGSRLRSPILCFVLFCVTGENWGEERAECGTRPFAFPMAIRQLVGCSRVAAGYTICIGESGLSTVDFRDLYNLPTS